MADEKSKVVNLIIGECNFYENQYNWIIGSNMTTKLSLSAERYTNDCFVHRKQKDAKMHDFIRLKIYFKCLIFLELKRHAFAGEDIEQMILQDLSTGLRCGLCLLQALSNVSMEIQISLTLTK